MSRHVRRAIVIGYSLGWLKPYENLWLSYHPHIAKSFPAELAELAGYVQHRPNLGNFEGQCPSILLRDNVPEFPRAHRCSETGPASRCPGVRGGKTSCRMSPAHVLEPTFQRLKRSLMEGTWPPGEKLEALQLADEFGVSMTPVRDCLNRLVGERLVDMKPGEGYRVPRISEKILRDILELNALLLNFAINGRDANTHSCESENANLSYADRVTSLFDFVGSRSDNIVVGEIIRSVSERMHAVRRRDPQFFSDTLSEIQELEQLAGAGSTKLLSKLNDYHSRRRGNDTYLMYSALP